MLQPSTSHPSQAELPLRSKCHCPLRNTPMLELRISPGFVGFAIPLATAVSEKIVLPGTVTVNCPFDTATSVPRCSLSESFVWYNSKVETVGRFTSDPEIV